MGEQIYQESDQRIWVKNIFRILDLLEPLRQRFQNFGPTGTLASKISEFRTYWNPCVKDFRILDLLEPLRQRFPDFEITLEILSIYGSKGSPRKIDANIRNF